MEYVATGAVGDTTPPAAPTHVTVTRQQRRRDGRQLAGRRGFRKRSAAFIVERDGQFLAQVPETPVGKYGRPLFQTLSFHDTPEAPLPEMRFVDATADSKTSHSYTVIAVNSVELKSAPSTPAKTIVAKDP